MKCFEMPELPQPPELGVSKFLVAYNLKCGSASTILLEILICASGVNTFHRRPCRGTGNERKFPLQNHQRANAPRSQRRVGPVWLARDPPTTCDARRVVWKWGWLPGVLGGPALAAPMAPWAACGVGVGGHVRIAPAPFLMRVGNEGGQSTF